MRYDLEKRKFTFKKWIEKKKIYEVQKAWRSEYQTKYFPSHVTIMRWVSLFEKHGSVDAAPRESKADNDKRVAVRNLIENLVSEKP